MKKFTLSLGLGLLAAIAIASLALAKLEQLPLGQKAPDFSLTDINGKKHSLSSLTKDGKVVVLEWYNPLCPAVKKYREKSDFMNQTWNGLDHSKVVWLCINSGAAGKEGAGKQASAEGAKLHQISVPVLLDEDGKVGKAYGASVTPTIYVIDKKQHLVYRGAPDESSALDKEPRGKNFISAAVEAALKGKAPATAETKAFGCTVKYAD